MISFTLFGQRFLILGKSVLEQYLLCVHQQNYCLKFHDHADTHTMYHPQPSVPGQYSGVIRAP